MKIVGARNRSEIEPDPQKAWSRCKAMDAMLRASPRSYERGAWRLTHAQMNRLDFERQLAQAAKVNLGMGSGGGSPQR
jgi:hypothetical protein